MSKNDGGPAFPRPASTDEHTEPCNHYLDQQGMSLRDWFAGQALAGIKPEPSCWTPADLAARAYVIADAMIAERNKKTENN